MGIQLKAILVEAYNSIRIVERYHAPIRRAYRIISAEIRDIDKDIALQIAFKAVNDSAGPNGLVLTLLVYSAFLRISVYNLPYPTVI